MKKLIAKVAKKTAQETQKNELTELVCILDRSGIPHIKMLLDAQGER